MLLDAQASMYLSSVEAARGPLPGEVFDALAAAGQQKRLSQADVERVLAGFLVLPQASELVAYRADADADGAAPRVFGLGAGVELVVDATGEPFVRHPEDPSVLQAQGFTQGTAELWVFSKREELPLMRGSFDLPGGVGLFVHVRGEVLVDPRREDFVPLEEQGFAWASESGLLLPPEAPGRYPLPGGAHLLVRQGGGIAVDVLAEHAAMLVAQGFVGEEAGVFGLPRQGGRGALRPGEYEVAQGAARLVVQPTGVLAITAARVDTTALLAHGFSWLEDGRLLAVPT